MGTTTPTATMLIGTACMAGRTVTRILTRAGCSLNGALGGSQLCSDWCGWGKREKGRGESMGGRSSQGATA